MRLALLILIAFVLFGCATTEQGKRITSDDVTWIERERTTRAEVVARFGLPPVEFPQSSGFTTASTTTTITTIALEGHAKNTSITKQIQRPTSLRKAIYVYTHRDPAPFPFYDNLEFTQSQFWVVYDEKGVVQDYGFLGDPPITRQEEREVRSACEKPSHVAVERHQQSIAGPQLTNNALQDRRKPSSFTLGLER